MYDEVWAVDAERIKRFFKDHPDEVTVIPLPDRTLGSMTMPQTRIICSCTVRKQATENKR